MNLQGKIVKVHVPELERHVNNNNATCPAMVLTDWNPEAEDKEKVLNLRIFYDNPEDGYETSVPHKDIPGGEIALRWE